MSLNLLRELVKVREELRRTPTAGGLKRFEVLKLMGAGTCPECEEELDLTRYRRHVTDTSIREFIRCASCGNRFDLTEAPIN